MSEKKPKKAKWFTDLPKEEQKAIEKREKEYRKQLLANYIKNQKSKK